MAPCRVCNDLQKKDEYDPRLGFDFTPKELEDSASKRNCTPCIVILEGIRQTESIDWVFEKDVRRVYARCWEIRNGHDATLSLEIYFTDERPRLELEFYSLEPTAWKAIFPRHMFSDHPLSPQSLQWVRAKMTECTESHTLCKEGTQVEPPTRLLSLRPLDDDSLEVKLVDRHEQSSSYAALSHCWGKEQLCVLTRDTLLDRMTNVPWETIPATFRDAMRYAVRLGIEYIWIDSLCIIQDSKDDWEYESSKMAEVYRYATVVLAATASPGALHGCFPNSGNGDSSKEIKLPKDIEPCRISVRKLMMHWNMLSVKQYKEHFPLLSRGWVFQERLLGRRTLHFCKNELVWECRQMTACECGGIKEQSSVVGKYYLITQENEPAIDAAIEGTAAIETYESDEDEDLGDSLTRLFLARCSPNSIHPSHRASAPPKGLSVPFSVFHHIRESPLKEPTVASHFHRIVEDYSALSLTKTSDRLPALSGLCKQTQRLRDAYVAGLWTDSFRFDLMWRVDSLNLAAPNGGRPLQYRGPTWSWASIDSPVKYWSDLTYDRFPTHGEPIPLGYSQKLTRVRIHIPGKNPFGEVGRAAMAGEASCATRTLVYDNDNPAQYRVAIVDNVEIPFFADYVLSAEGPFRVEAGEALRLFFVHHTVVLVLRPCKRTNRRAVKDSAPEDEQWERIGIARLSEVVIDYLREEWRESVRGSELSFEKKWAELCAAEFHNNPGAIGNWMHGSYIQPLTIM